jgi:hypothetical protein
MLFFEIAFKILLALALMRLAGYLWHKFPKYQHLIAYAFGVPFIGGLLYIAVMPLEKYLQRTIVQSSPEIVVSFEGMALEQNLSDLRRHNILVPMKSTPLPEISVFSVSKTRMQFTTNYADVDNKNQTVKAISHLCPSVNNLVRNPIELQGITCVDHPKDIIKKFGDAKVVMLCWGGSQKTGVSTAARIYDLPSYNIRYRVLGGRILSMQVGSPEYFAQLDRNHWFACVDR